MLCKGRVLSVQSHVVHGYVGNKSAVFPLQVLGFEVDAINSVQFSNHTGYEHIEGQVLDEKDLSSLFNGLRKNNILQGYTHALTGYIGNKLFLREVADIIKEMRTINPKLIYVCDPVMGDNGRMYVPEELLPIYQTEILPLANIATPNQYEVELITERSIKTEEDVWNSMNWFHDRNVDIVALSSSTVGAPNTLMAFLSCKNGLKYKMSIPKQGNNIDFIGTGDLFASLFLAHSTDNENLGKAFELTIATLQCVLKTTIEAMPADVKIGKRLPSFYERELKLIQSKGDIENPDVKIKAISK